MKLKVIARKTHNGLFEKLCELSTDKTLFIYTGDYNLLTLREKIRNKDLIINNKCRFVHLSSNNPNPSDIKNLINKNDFDQIIFYKLNNVPKMFEILQEIDKNITIGIQLNSFGEIPYNIRFILDHSFISIEYI